eukprot:155368-Chlamydomonas_euryale.AAC.2
MQPAGEGGAKRKLVTHPGSLLRLCDRVEQHHHAARCEALQLLLAHVLVQVCPHLWHLGNGRRQARAAGGGHGQVGVCMGDRRGKQAKK